MPAQDYERGRFAIRDLFASSRSTGVVYGVADSDVADLSYVTEAVPICGRAAAQRDVILDPGPSAGPPEGAVSEGDIP